MTFEVYRESACRLVNLYWCRTNDCKIFLWIRLCDDSCSVKTDSWVEYKTLYVNAAIFWLAHLSYHHRFLGKELNDFDFILVFCKTDTHMSHVFGG